MANKFASANEAKLNYVVETTPGTTPGTPTTTQLPYTKADLVLNKGFYKDSTLWGDRMSRYTVPGLQKVSGSLSGELSHTNFNAILTTLMCSTAASKVFTTGQTLNTITLEQWLSDLSLSRVYSGCFADKFQLKVDPKGLVTFDASIMGFNMTTGTTLLNSSPTAATNETPFACLTATFKEGGNTIAYANSFDITIDNSMTAQDVIGSAVPSYYTPGASKVTGSLTFWVQDFTVLSKFVNGTASSLEVSLSDGTNTWDIKCPVVYYVGEKFSVSGNSAIPLTLNFEAERDPATGSNVIITYS